MKEYIFQVKMYTNYFLKISISNKFSYFYSLAIPGIMLYLQLPFENHNMEFVYIISTSWLAYMIVNHALTYTFKVSFLREQGYLKQYHTIVKDMSIFLSSQGLAGFINLIGSSLLITLLLAFLTELSFISFATVTTLVILLVYPPLIMLFSFFLSFQMRQQTINMIRNIASSVLMFLTFITQNIHPRGMDVLINLFNPIILTMKLYSIILEMDLLNFGIQILPVLIIYVFIGMLSMKHIAILPIEGIL